MSQTLDAVLAKGQMMPERNRFPAGLGPPGSDCAPVAFDPVNVTSKANRSNPKPGDPHHTLHSAPGILAFSSKDSGADAGEHSPTLRSMSHANSHMNGGGQVAIAHTTGAGFWKEGAGTIRGREQESHEHLVAHSLRGEGFDASEDGTGRGTPLVPIHHAVRRITPRECERLQGFPDDWTKVPYNGKPAKDSPRYKAIGNSMAVPVMRIIGERIAFVDAIPYPEASLQ